MEPELVEVTDVTDQTAASTPEEEEEARPSFWQRVHSHLQRSIRQDLWGYIIRGVIWVLAWMCVLSIILSVVVALLGSASSPLLVLGAVFSASTSAGLAAFVLHQLVQDGLTWLMEPNRRFIHMVVTLALMCVSIGLSFGALYLTKWAVSVCLH